MLMYTKKKQENCLDHSSTQKWLRFISRDIYVRPTHPLQTLYITQTAGRNGCEGGLGTVNSPDQMKEE